MSMDAKKLIYMMDGSDFHSELLKWEEIDNKFISLIN